MPIGRVVRITGAAGLVMAMPLTAALTQTPSPAPSPQTPPAATKPNTPSMPSSPPSDKKAATPASTNLVGLTAKSSDGTNLGTVHSVITNPGGRTTIGVKVGGFLGFGGHMVALPDGRFNRVGDTVEVNMTAGEVEKLPQAVEQK
jgi:PRC-barrel domain